MDVRTCSPLGLPSPGRSPLSHQPQLSPSSLYRVHHERTDTPQPLSLKIEKPSSYGSPPPVAANHPDNNVCKMIEYRAAKVAAFMVDGRELICLPQAFDLFLKHLVGGLHTVYTKLKRLEITPIVCNVEQVRILRGLGAIQPGVNRCKLISCKEFDILYEDCTNSSVRPGRPLKRSPTDPATLSPCDPADASSITHFILNGLTSFSPPSRYSARPGRPPKRSPIMHANPDTLEKLKKSRMETDYLYGANRLLGEPKTHSALTNGYHHYPPHLSMLPFLPMSYPAMTSATNMVMGGHLGVGAIDGTVLKARNGDEVDSISPRSHSDGRLEGEDHRSHYPHHHHQSDLDKERLIHRMNGAAHDKESGISTASDLSIHGPHDYKKYQLPTAHPQTTSQQPDDLTMDDGDSDGDDEDESDQTDYPNRSQSQESADKYSATKTFPQLPLTHDINGPSSLEALLLNIQGLLKVAAEHAKQKDRQVQYEAAELKVEVMRERELRESLERRLIEEQRVRETFQKRWRKEKRARRKLEEQMELAPSSGQRGFHMSTDDGQRSVVVSSESQDNGHTQRMVNVYDHISSGPFVSGTNQTAVIHTAIKTNG